MKNQIQLVFVLLLIAFAARAQTPALFKYQSVVRDGDGAIIAEQDVSFQINILAGSDNGNSVYTEEHSVTTNAFGLANMTIGNGAILFGNLADIDWSAELYFLQIAVDTDGGSDFVVMGASQLMSVPYALHARTVENDAVDDADADPANEIQDLSLDGTTLRITNNANASDIDLSPLQGNDTDEQALDLEGNILSITNGNAVDLSTVQDGFQANTDEQTLLVEGLSLHISGGNSVDLSNIQDGVDDADADATNEIQDLQLSGSTLSISNNPVATNIDLAPFQGNNTDEQILKLEDNVLSISNGNNVDLSVVQDGFEANTDSQSLAIDGTELKIMGGNTIDLAVAQDGYERNTDKQKLSFVGTDLNISGGNTVNLSRLADGVEDADADPENEIQDLSLDGSTLSITNNENATNIDLSPFQGDNTDEQTLDLEGNVLSISNGNEVDLAVIQDGFEANTDAQNLSVDGTDLNISGGNTVDLLTIQDGFEPNTDDQNLSLEGTSLNISGGNSVDLSAVQDGVDDADADATNEIQDLNLIGSTLSITNNEDATGIDLSPFQGNNTDEQTLGLDDNLLSISNGNDVDLSSIQDGFEANTDAQNLSLEGTDLNISGGNSIDLSSLQDGVEDEDADATNEIQDLVLDGATISITNNDNATDIDLSVIQDGFEVNTDAQNLSLEGTDLNISGGNTIDLSNLQDDADADITNEIQDLRLDGSTLSITNNESATDIDLSPFQGNNTDEQTLGLDGNVLSISNGNDVNLSSIQDGFEANTDGQSLSLEGTDLNITGGNSVDLSSLQDGVDDADADASNELQDLVLDGSTLSITNNVNATDIDLSPFQGNNTDEQTLDLDGNVLSISNGNDVNLSSIQDGFEANTDGQSLSLEGTDLNITGGNSVDLSSLQDGVDDADADASNELQDLVLDGSTLSITNNVNATDIDLSPFQGNDTDEQTLGLDGNVLSITNGNDVDLSAIQDGFEANTDAQSLSLDGTDLNISGGNTIDLSGLQDGVDDADADATNEIQDLSLVGTTLTITDNVNASDIDLSLIQDGFEANTDAQDLSLSGNVLSLTNDGSIVDLSGFMDDTDDQNLLFNGTSISITGGNSVDVSALNSLDLPVFTTSSNASIDNTSRMVRLTASVELTLPASPTSGQILYVFGSGQASINPNGRSFRDGNDFLGAITRTFVDMVGGTGTVILIFDGFNWNFVSKTGGTSDDSNQTLSLVGTDLTISDANTVDLSSLQDGVDDADADATNEIQDLSLVGSTLSITNNASATDIDLSPFQGDNTDEQILSLTGTTLSITNGNGIDLSSLQDGVDDADADAANEIQDLSLVGSTLSITNNASATDIDLSPFQGDNTDEQTLSLTGTNLSITNGNNVNLSTVQDGFEANTDAQGVDAFSLSGTTLSLSLDNDGEASQTVDLASLKENITDGDGNVMVGTSALGSNVTGVNNVAIGTLAIGTNTTGSLNIAIGKNASRNNTTGSGNVSIGVESDFINESGSNNTIIGYQSGRTAAAISSQHSKSGSVFIGYQSGYSEKNSNKLYIENSSSTSPLIYGEFDNDMVQINGTLNVTEEIKITGGTPGVGKVLTSDATGLASWVAPGGGAGTDDQTIDVLSLSGTTLSMSLEGDGEANETVNLASLQDGFEANTDGQTLSLAGSTLSIAGGNSVNLPAGGGGAGDQTIDALSLSGTTLSMSLEGDGEANKTVNLASLQDGFEANTDGQTLSLAGSTLSIAGGNSVNLTSIQDGFDLNTDEQDLSLSGASLSISGGNSVDLSSLQDGTGTDNQTIDQLELAGTSLLISLEGDGEGTQSLNLAGLQDGIGTDDQTIDEISLSGNTLSISLEGDNEANKTVDLSSIAVADIDDLTDGLSNGNDLFLGASSGLDLTIADGQNTGVGNLALSNVTTGQFNTAIGYNSHFSNVSGASNVSVGSNALDESITGSRNSAIGSSALAVSNGSDNVSIGYSSAQLNETGVENVVIGSQADLGNVGGSSNTIIGFQAGVTLGPSLAHTKSGSVMIGYKAGGQETNSDRLYIENSSSSMPLIGGNFSSNELYFNGNVGVGMGNIAATEQFQVGTNGDGTLAIANAWNTFSDRRWKKNISTLDDGLAKVMALRGVTYKWKSTDKDDLGFIAQEVEEVLPLLVKTGESGYKSVDYARVTAVLVEAVKELKSQIDALTNKNKRLNAQLTQLDKLREEVKLLSSIILGSKKQASTTTP